MPELNPKTDLQQQSISLQLLSDTVTERVAQTSKCSSAFDPYTQNEPREAVSCSPQHPSSHPHPEQPCPTPITLASSCVKLIFLPVCSLSIPSRGQGNRCGLSTSGSKLPKCYTPLNTSGKHRNPDAFCKNKLRTETIINLYPIAYFHQSCHYPRKCEDADEQPTSHSKDHRIPRDKPRR